MCDTILEESSSLHDLELDMGAEIEQELLSILTNVETITEAMDRVISKEEDRRKQFKDLCSMIDYLFSEKIVPLSKKYDG